MEIDLFDAWNLWSDGFNLDNYCLWNIEFIWWNRLGQIAQLLGALTILIEIIGVERINNFSIKLKRLYGIKILLKHLGRIFEAFLLSLSIFGGINLYLLHLEGKKKGFKSELGAVERYSISIWVIGLLASVLVSIFISIKYSWWYFIPSFLIIGQVFERLIPLVILLIVSIFWTFLYLLYLLILFPIIKVMENSVLDTIFKSIGILLIILGSHFVILSS